MYHLYNLLEPGDLVRAGAVRRVVSESSTGSTESHRVRVTLTIQVDKLSFDASGSTSATVDPTSVGATAAMAPAGGNDASAALGGSSGEGATLAVSGRVAEENKHVKMGAFHTLDLECGRQLTITKTNWDSVHLERLDESSEVGNRAEVAAVVMGEGEWRGMVESRS